jgi:murein DD-endopeptidase MepM/ murein hydrolase activator NlpD
MFLEIFDPIVVIANQKRCEKLDLSATNTEIQELDLSDCQIFSVYVFNQIEKLGVDFLWGGYLEKRTIYSRSEVFKNELNPERNIHLGIDLWCKAGTSVFAALDGKIHSFADNRGWGDYGPTIILKHELGETTFHTLYGHLSRESLSGLEIGQEVIKGQEIAQLGRAEVNGDYPPHLHFQIIIDLQGKNGDYPGVCTSHEIDFYKHNCPDPNLLLKLY